MFKSLEMISNCTDWTWRLFPRTIHLSIQQSPILCFEYLFPNWHFSLRNSHSLGIWMVVVWWHFSTFNSPPRRDFARRTQGHFVLTSDSQRVSNLDWHATCSQRETLARLKDDVQRTGLNNCPTIGLRQCSSYAFSSQNFSAPLQLPGHMLDLKDETWAKWCVSLWRLQCPSLWQYSGAAVSPDCWITGLPGDASTLRWTVHEKWKKKKRNKIKKTSIVLNHWNLTLRCCGICHMPNAVAIGNTLTLVFSV